MRSPFKIPAPRNRYLSRTLTDSSESGDGGQIMDNPTRAYGNGEYNLIGSLCVDGKHRPALDLDMPCQLFESKEDGKFHLYIDHPMSEEDYFKLLKALWKAGLVEEAYYRISRRRGTSLLRRPRVKV